MRKLPAVLLALPLGELAKPEALTERAYAVALSAKGVKCSKNFPAAPPLPQEAGAVAAVFLHDPTRENAAPERPQAFRGCRSKIIFPLKMPRAARKAF